MTLTIKGNNIVYEQDPNNGWALSIDKIKFIGEYTTSEGPLTHDYFFVFADTIDQWWQAPTIAVNHDTFWKEIGQKLNGQLFPGLFASTNWATRVIYPKSIEGQELFKVVKSKSKPKNIWQKIFALTDEGEHLELTDHVKVLFK